MPVSVYVSFVHLLPRDAISPRRPSSVTIITEESDGAARGKEHSSQDDLQLRSLALVPHGSRTASPRGSNGDDVCRGK